MTNILTIVFAVTMTILTIVLAVVGVQLILVLIEFKKTLRKINLTLAEAEAKIQSIVDPLQNLGGIAHGLKTGVKVFEGFVGWLNKNKKQELET